MYTTLRHVAVSATNFLKSSIFVDLYIHIFFPDKCREERKDFESLVLNKLNELLEIAHSNPVEHQVRKIQTFPLLPSMPFKNINDLQRFDESLKNNERIRDQFVSIQVSRYKFKICYFFKTSKINVKYKNLLIAD